MAAKKFRSPSWTARRAGAAGRLVGIAEVAEEGETGRRLLEDLSPCRGGSGRLEAIGESPGRLLEEVSPTFEGALKALSRHLGRDEPDPGIDDAEQEDGRDDEQNVRHEEPTPDPPEKPAHQVPERAHGEDQTGEDEEEDSERLPEPTGRAGSRRDE